MPFHPTARIVAALCVLLPTASAQIFVDPNATGNGTGTSWANAFRTLQPALAAAQSGQEVWIAENALLTTTGGPFVVPAGVTVIGSLRVGMVLPYRTAAAPSFLLASFGSRTLSLGDGATIRGLAIQMGDTASGGGGLRILGTKATIDGCSFAGSTISGGEGSDLLIGAKADVLIQSTDFRGVASPFPGRNPADSVVVRDAKATFVNCEFESADANGLLVAGTADVTLVNCRFQPSTGFGLVVPSATSSFWMGHCGFNGPSRGVPPARPMSYLGNPLTTLTQVNAVPGAGNHVLNHRVTDLGMVHPLLSAFDYAGGQRNLDNDFDGIAVPDIGILESAYVLTGLTSPLPATVKQGGNLVIGNLAGIQQLLMIGVGVQAGVPLVSWGRFYLQGPLLGPFPVPAPGLTIPIPASMPLGTTAYLQGLQVISGGAQLSTPASVVVN